MHYWKCPLTGGKPKGKTMTDVTAAMCAAYADMVIRVVNPVTNEVILTTLRQLGLCL